MWYRWKPAKVVSGGWLYYLFFLTQFDGWTCLSIFPFISCGMLIICMMLCWFQECCGQPQKLPIEKRALRKDAVCEVNALTTSVSSYLCQQRLFEFYWAECEDKQFKVRTTSIHRNTNISTLIPSPPVSYSTCYETCFFIFTIHMEQHSCCVLLPDAASQLLAITPSNLLNED